MKRKIRFRLTIVSIVCAMLVLIIGCSNNKLTIEGTYVNANVEPKPMVFGVETVGVLEFVEDNKVDILFPYAIDTKKLSSSISLSSELWIAGEYKRTGNTITIQFKLSKDQKEPGVIKVEINNEGKTLVTKQGNSFNKIDKPLNKK